jgi:copper resistance protein D
MAVQPTPVPIALLLLVLCVFISPARSQQQDTSNMNGMPGMDRGNTTMPAGQGFAELAAERPVDTRVSEFNHHLAGFILFLASIFVFAAESLAKRWSLVRYMWPMCFLAAGVFVLVFSDAEIWPLGPQTPWYALTHSLEDLQHKGFAVILLALGYVEFQRARGRFKGVLSVLFCTVVAIVGAILLLFHVHGGDMRTPDAMEVMGRIQAQHRWFAAAGLGIAVTKGLAEITQNWRQILKKTWPALLAVLGILLMAYKE